MISNFALQDTGRTLIVHKTLRRRLWRLLNMLCTINLRPVSTGLGNYCHMKLLLWCFSGFKQLSAFQKKRTVLVNFHVFLYPSNIYLFNINSRNTRNMFKVNVKTPEQHHWCRFGVCIVDLEHFSHLFQCLYY